MLVVLAGKENVMRTGFEGQMQVKCKQCDGECRFRSKRRFDE